MATMSGHSGMVVVNKMMMVMWVMMMMLVRMMLLMRMMVVMWYIWWGNFNNNWWIWNVMAVTVSCPVTIHKFSFVSKCIDCLVQRFFHDLLQFQICDFFVTYFLWNLYIHHRNCDRHAIYQWPEEADHNIWWWVSNTDNVCVPQISILNVILIVIVLIQLLFYQVHIYLDDSYNLHTGKFKQIINE